MLPDQLITRYSAGFETESKMVFDAFPDYSYPLTFQEVDTEADPKTGSYKVTMVMERPTDIGILPGMVWQRIPLFKSQCCYQDSNRGNDYRKW